MGSGTDCRKQKYSKHGCQTVSVGTDAGTNLINTSTMLYSLQKNMRHGPYGPCLMYDEVYSAYINGNRHSSRRCSRPLRRNRHGRSHSRHNLARA